MKQKRIFALFLSATLSLTLLAGCGKKQGSGTQITLNEVAHSIFYAPQYVAYELGYFKEEGLDVTIETGFGADKTMTALISGDADIGFMGSEASIYQYNEGNEDYAINFAQLTQRAGNFLVGREENNQFQWSDLQGKELIGGRKGGMPEMILEYVLKKNGLDPEKDVTLIQNVDFANTAGAFAGGTGDYTVEFEPNATSLEQQGTGYVVASLGIELRVDMSLIRLIVLKKVISKKILILSSTLPMLFIKDSNTFKATLQQKLQRSSNLNFLRQILTH